MVNIKRFSSFVSSVHLCFVAAATFVFDYFEKFKLFRSFCVGIGGPEGTNTPIGIPIKLKKRKEGKIIGEKKTERKTNRT